MARSAADDKTSPVLTVDTTATPKATAQGLRKPKKGLTPDQRTKETEKRDI